MRAVHFHACAAGKEHEGVNVPYPCVWYIKLVSTDPLVYANKKKK